MSELRLGLLRRKNHGDGLSIWCLMQTKDFMGTTQKPLWQCVYSTSVDEVGDCATYLNDAEDIGMLPGVES